MTVLAHSGHWLVSLIYLAPVVLVVGWIGITNIRDRRSEKRSGGAPPTEAPR